MAWIHWRKYRGRLRFLNKVGLGIIGWVGYTLKDVPWRQGEPFARAALDAVARTLSGPVPLWHALAAVVAVALLSQVEWRRPAQPPPPQGPPADSLKAVLDELQRASRELGAAGEGKGRADARYRAAVDHLGLARILARACRDDAAAQFRARWPGVVDGFYSVGLRLGSTFRMGIEDVYSAMRGVAPRASKGCEVVADVGRLLRDVHSLLLSQQIHAVPVAVYLDAADGRWHVDPEVIFERARADMDAGILAVGKIFADAYVSSIGTDESLSTEPHP